MHGQVQPSGFSGNGRWSRPVSGYASRSSYSSSSGGADDQLLYAFSDRAPDEMDGPLNVTASIIYSSGRQAYNIREQDLIMVLLNAWKQSLTS
jgi:hypothetical protein